MPTNNPSLKELLVPRIVLKMNRATHNQLEKWCIAYEVRDRYPEVFNSPLLAIYPANFFTKDVNALFNILEVDKDEFSYLIKQCKSVNQDFVVTSDLFNLLVVYAAHCTMHSPNLTIAQKDKVLMILFKMLHYKFFTSVVNHRLPHGANLEIMQATIDTMSKKFDIIKPETNTWKLVIEARCRDIFSKRSIHFSALNQFSPDKQILYIISDAQTRMRTKLGLVINAYREMHAKATKIGTTSLIDNAGEEKTIKDIVATYDTMISSVTNKALNVNQFIKHKLIELVSKLIPNVRPDAMRTILTRFSMMAMRQYQKQQQDLKSKDGKILIGFGVLIDAIIQKTYRACMLEKVNMKSQLDILNRAKDMYRSSRIADPGILQVKESVAEFVEGLRVSNREATKASLKIAFILYIILLSFNYGE